MPENTNTNSRSTSGRSMSQRKRTSTQRSASAKRAAATRQRRNRVNRVVKRNGKAAQRDLQRNAEQVGSAAADAVREVQTQVQSLV